MSRGAIAAGAGAALAIGGGAFALRAVGADLDGMAVMEWDQFAGAAEIARGGSVAEFMTRTFHGPLQPLLIWLGLLCSGGLDESIPRLLTTIVSVASIGVTAGLARHSGFTWRGTAAVAILAATAPWHVYFGSSLRPYALHYLLVAAAYWAYWALLRTGRWVLVPAFAATVALAGWNHMLSGLLIAPMGLHWLIWGRGERGFAKASGGALLGLAATVPKIVIATQSIFIDEDLVPTGYWWVRRIMEQLGPVPVIYALMALGVVTLLGAVIPPARPHWQALAARLSKWAAFGPVLGNLVPAALALQALWFFGALVLTYVASDRGLNLTRPVYVLPVLAPAILMAVHVAARVPKPAGVALLATFVSWNSVHTGLLINERFSDDISNRRIDHEVRRLRVAAQLFAQHDCDDAILVAWPWYTAGGVAHYLWQDHRRHVRYAPVREYQGRLVLPNQVFCLLIFGERSQNPSTQGETARLWQTVNQVPIKLLAAAPRRSLSLYRVYPQGPLVEPEVILRPHKPAP